MCPSAPRVCSEPGGQKPILSLSLDLIFCVLTFKNVCFFVEWQQCSWWCMAHWRTKRILWDHWDPCCSFDRRGCIPTSKSLAHHILCILRYVISRIHPMKNTRGFVLLWFSVVYRLIARFIRPIWGPSGTDWTQMGPMLAPWTLL